MGHRNDTGTVLFVPPYLYMVENGGTGSLSLCPTRGDLSETRKAIVTARKVAGKL